MDMRLMTLVESVSRRLLMDAIMWLMGTVCSVIRGLCWRVIWMRVCRIVRSRIAICVRRGRVRSVSRGIRLGKSTTLKHAQRIPALSPTVRPATPAAHASPATSTSPCQAPHASTHATSLTV